MQVRHPEALDGVGGECPDRVNLGGESYDCGGGATFDAPRAQADALAARYGVDVERIAVGDETDTAASDGRCEVVKNDGEVCGRERPCPYHD